MSLSQQFAIQLNENDSPFSHLLALLYVLHTIRTFCKLFHQILEINIFTKISQVRATSLITIYPTVLLYTNSFTIQKF